jgi:hypothetical protein
MFINLKRGRIYATVLSPLLRIRLSRFTMPGAHFVMVVAGLIPEQHGLFFVLLHWHEVAPAILLHRLLLIPLASCIELSMTRPRGRPRRGAPWRPRRPSVMPPDSTSTKSYPRQQTKSPHVSLQVLQFNSMVVIPSMPISTLWLSLDPLAYPSNPMPF